MSDVIELKVPDIGGHANVDVIDVLVKPGDTVEVEQSLITLETDKATMDVPAEKAGVVKEVLVKKGGKVSEGSPIVVIEVSDAGVEEKLSAGVEATAPIATKPAPVEVMVPQVSAAETPPPAAPVPVPGVIAALAPIDEIAFAKAHAGPSVRHLARELGVDLSKIVGSGRKNRITPDDVKLFVKGIMSGGTPVAGAGSMGVDLLPWPQVDFAKFGPVESVPLSRIKKISGANLRRNWVHIPHVTVHEDADMTELEAFRKQIGKEWEKDGQKLSPLAFIIKACAATLQAFPDFNASLDGENLILKHYYHIGFAADTPNGLVVPVIRDVDQKGLRQITEELGNLSKLAREGKLKPTDMQGATFTVSSLGGIGGTGFTPIVNAPEVAILGVCKSQMKPHWNGSAFEPRLMCPLSLSFDHRVVDGAAGMRFIVHLAALLADFRRVML